MVTSGSEEVHTGIDNACCSLDIFLVIGGYYRFGNIFFQQRRDERRSSRPRLLRAPFNGATTQETIGTYKSVLHYSVRAI